MDKSTTPNFNFVNLTHPDELKDEETQLRIRRLAMTEVGKARRKPKTKRARHEIILEFRDSPGSQHSRTELDRLSASNVDPFTSYPIDMNEDTRSLVVNIFRQNSNHATLLRGAWWPVGLYDPSVFHIVLANSQLYIHMQLNGPFVNEDDSMSLSHHSKALQLVSAQLQDPKQHTSDSLIGAVAGLMCHDYIIGAFERWEQHRNAVLRMIELRGGLSTITREELRITLSWCDLAGSFSRDIPASLPMPPKWAEYSRSPPSSPRPYSTMSIAWKQQLPMSLDWITIFDDVVQLISLDKALIDPQLEAASSSGSWMEPTMVRLLSIRPMLIGNDTEHIIEEVCRLGTLLFLAPVWRYMGANPVWTFSFSRNLSYVLNTYRAEWADLKPLLVWTVYFAAIETRDLRERGQFVFLLAMLMNGMQIQEWEELLQVVKSVLWVDKVFVNSEEAIRDEVMAIITKSPMPEAVNESAAE